MTQEQQHPQWAVDRHAVDQLLDGEPTDYNLAELGRLRIRYQGFPGARDIQADLEKLLQRWQLTEAELFERTRAIHTQGQVYRLRSATQEDWN